MAGIKGMKHACAGLTDEEVQEIVSQQYADFCKYRPLIHSLMPDRRISLFSRREFSGAYFEKA